MCSEKVAVVTGANKGIGYEIVKGLCEKYDGIVYLTSRDEKRGRNACVKLEELGLKPVYHQLDVTDKGSIERFRAYVQQKHGKVDLLINNAGILFAKDSTEPKIFRADETLFVNFRSLVNFTEAMIPLLNDGGKIVNISSSAGHLSRIPSEELRRRISSPNLTLKELNDLIAEYIESVLNNKYVEDGWADWEYVVSKVAVNAYTFMLHRKLSSRGILVNCVHPGYVMSDMTSGAGNVTPAQGAAPALQLALRPPCGGLYVWSDGEVVPWDGPDPRGYKDGLKV